MRAGKVVCYLVLDLTKNAQSISSFRMMLTGFLPKCLPSIFHLIKNFVHHFILSTITMGFSAFNFFHYVDLPLFLFVRYLYMSFVKLVNW